MRSACAAKTVSAASLIAALIAASCGQTSIAPTSETVLTAAPTTEVLVSPTTAGAPVTAFVDVAVVTMTTNITLPGQTVLVEGDRIVAIGPVAEVDVADEVNVVDGGGAFLMPGLADMHVHLDDVWPVPMLDLFLTNGVTTVRNMNARDPTVLVWRDAVAAGTRHGPTVFTAGPTIYEDTPDLDAVVADQLNQGYDFIKLYSFLSPEGFEAAMAAVKDHAGYAVGHVPFAVGLDGVIAAGMDEIAHIEELTFELIDFDRSSEQLGADEWLPYIFERAEAELQSSGIEALMAERIARVVEALRSADIPVATTVFISELIVENVMHPRPSWRVRNWLHAGDLPDRFRGRCRETSSAVRRA